jgi:hypothetical protein
MAARKAGLAAEPEDIAGEHVVAPPSGGCCRVVLQTESDVCAEGTASTVEFSAETVELICIEVGREFEEAEATRLGLCET